ncbi:hypothetical protein OK016_15450 [Vibrio chagasii]|nr:hypothetical protein [Vibrio chagasii]
MIDIEPLAGWQKDAMLRVAGAIEVGLHSPISKIAGGKSLKKLGD